ncbi:tripartite tricarboxylate transporter substrate-binding protein [Humitalea rosea]|uniref:tripartite tricarboxylate transporter substrate-binding protein n=1 Tax=Humitalea rosea TaxID=990373 RepID=UPI000DAD9740|nr:tripartite tricarboxylate transporter substrate-binding protein [Humitalea rosea]
MVPIAETFSNYRATAWYGILVPKGVPQAIRDKLSATVLASVTTPEVATRLRDEGAEPSRMDAAAFGAFIAEERTRWAQVVRAGAINVD